MAIMNARLKRKRSLTTDARAADEESENAAPTMAKSAKLTATLTKKQKRGQPQVINKTRLKENAAAAAAAAVVAGRRSNRNRASTVYED